MTNAAAETMETQRQANGDYLYGDFLIQRRPDKRFDLFRNGEKLNPKRLSFKEALALMAEIGQQEAEEVPPAPLHPDVIYARIEKLVREHGPSFAYEGAKTDEILAGEGLTREDVTEALLDRADRVVRRETEQKFIESNKSAESLPVVKEGHPELDPDLNPNHPVPGRAKALQEQQTREKEEVVNRLQTGKFLKSNMKETDMSLQVKEKAARGMLKELGNVAAENSWGFDKVVKILNRFEERAEKDHDLESKEFKLLRDSILKALRAGKKVEVIREDSTNGNGHHSNGKEKKVATATKEKVKKEPKEKKLVEKDRFGNRIGSGVCDINALLGKKPLTAAEIAETLKFETSRVQSHLYTLLKRGHVKKTEKGFVVA